MSPADVKRHYENEQIARTYDQVRFGSFIGRMFDRLEKRALRGVFLAHNRVADGTVVLDVPCGTGRITELWLELGLNVVGGDISNAMLSVAREKCSRYGSVATFRHLDLDALDLMDNQFDVVSCVRLFHHLETKERTAVLRELARVSSRFVIVNVSYSSPIYRLRRSLKTCLGQGISRCSSSWSEIENEASSSGLRVVSVKMICPLISEDMVLVLEKIR